LFGGKHIVMKFVCSFFVAAALLSAAPVQVKLVSGGAPPNTSIGPYTLSVGGKNVLGLCIDSKISTPAGTQWSANISQVGGDISNAYDPFSTTALNTVYYEEEAYLFSLITKTGADTTGIQHAAWDLTNPNTFTDSDSLYYVGLAVHNYSTFNFAGYEIVSAVVKGSEQEFIIDPPPSAPEPASYALLGVGLLMAVGARQWARRNKQLPVAVR
jgi:hypothetical protein